MKTNYLAKVIAIGAIAIGFATIGSAQTGGTPTGQTPTTQTKPKRVEPIVQALDSLSLSSDNKVTLTPDEKTKTDALVATRNENVKTYRKAHKGDKVAIHTYSQAQRKELLEGIKAALTTVQWTAFDTEYKKIMAADRAAKKSGAPAGTSF